MRWFLVGLAAFLFVAAGLSAIAQAATRGPDPAWSGPLTSATAAGLACNINTLNPALPNCLPFEDNSTVNRSRAPIMNVSNFTNAHAEVLLPAITQYQKTLCCWGLPALTGFCNLSGTSRPVNISGDPDVHDAVVRLSNNTNAHVEQYPLTTQNYNVNTCIGVGRPPADAGNTIISDCQYATSCGSLGTGYTCVATISNATNAHVANQVGGCAGSGDYGTKVCCKVVSDATPPTPTRVAPSVACGSLVQQDGHFTFVNYSDSGIGPLSACELEWAEASGVYRIDMAVGGTAGSGTPVGGTQHYCFYNQTNVPTSRFGSSLYWYRIRMEDKFTNFQWGSNCTLQFNFDTTSPSSSIAAPVTASSPYNANAWTTSAAVRGSATDNVGVLAVDIEISKFDGVRYYWTGSAWTITQMWLGATVANPGAASTTWTYSWTPGDFVGYRILSKAIDTGYNEETPGAGVTVTYDATAPDTTLNPHGTPTSDTTPQFTGQAADTTTNVEDIEYRVFNLDLGTETVPWTTVSFTPGPNPTYSFTVSSVLIDGFYNISVRSTDGAANVEQSVAFQVLQVSTSAPSSQINTPSVLASPINASEWNSSAVWGNATDNNNVKNVSLRVKRQSDGLFWDGGSWGSTEVWLATDLSNGGNGATTAWNRTWNTTADGWYNLSSRAEDPTSFEDPTPILIAYDATAPADLVVAPRLPAWMNATSWTVGWNGTDAVAGINITFVQYRVNGTGGWGAGQWQNSSAPASWTFGPSSPVAVADATTYSYRLVSEDLAGNSRSNGSNGEFNTTTDFTDPVAALGALPAWSNNPFDVTWNVTDTGSGVNWTNVTYSTDGATWLAVSNLAGCAVNGTGAYGCYGTDSVTYSFKAAGIDFAGNNGTDSAIRTTTIDTTAPSTVIAQLPAWSKSTQLNISWSGNDNGASGIACFLVQWQKNGGAWTNLTRDESACLGTGQRWEWFGPTFPTTVADGDNLGFRVRANDSVSNYQGWPADGDPQRTTGTTVDTSVPELRLRAVDQNGAALSEVAGGSGVTQVTIIANATDAGSGVASNFIEYWTTQGGIQSYATRECGSAASGAWSNCSVSVSFASGTQLKYRATATDLGGARNQSSLRFVVTHLLANFVQHDVFLTLGSSFLAELQVRNLLSAPVNVSVNLSGYEMAGFQDSGTGNFTIGGGGRELTVRELGSQEERTFQVSMLSSDPSSYVPALNLTAGNSASGAGALTDQDAIAVAVGFPASFSGLNGWAVGLLILLAVVIYFFVGRSPARPRRRHARHRALWLAE